jgi:lipoprotein-releasing system permease protein
LRRFSRFIGYAEPANAALPSGNVEILSNEPEKRSTSRDIEKKNDITLFNFLGATTKQTQHIFTLEGTLISSLGVIIGSIIGIAIVLLQEHFGLIEIKTNHSSQIYPVELQLLDIVIIISTVLIMGFLSSLFTAKKQIK